MKDLLILIVGFAVISAIIEALILYSGFRLFMAYTFYFLTMYGIVYEINKNYKRGEYSQLTRGDYIIHYPILFLIIFAYYIFGTMLYDETIYYFQQLEYIDHRIS